MNWKVAIAAFLVIAVAVASAAIFLSYNVADVTMQIKGANITIGNTTFELLNMKSGDEFSQTKSSTIKVVDVEEPYLRFTTDGLNSSEKENFENLSLDVEIGANKGTLDMLNGTEYVIDISEGTYDVNYTLRGTMGLIEEDTTINFHVQTVVSSRG